MRNLFDQYRHDENRLTHALAVCLDEDRGLLKDFLKWLGVAPPCAATKLRLVEQSLPGEPPVSEDVSDKRGLPDIVIHHDGSWCLLIESKIESTLTEDQMRRHRRTLRARDFAKVVSLALVKDTEDCPRGVICRRWRELYEWLGGQTGVWSVRLREYLRVAEVRMAQEEKLTEGTLTRFDGFRFSEDNPYTYGEAKRLLKLAMGELRGSAKLRKLGMDPKGEGRSAITGAKGGSVWDFLPLAARPRGAAFTRYPHLTLAVRRESLDIAVTIPHGSEAKVRQRLASLDDEERLDLHERILKLGKPLLKRDARLEAYAVQRHYDSQRSAGTVDARVSFRIETTLPRGARRVRSQPDWGGLFVDLLRRRKSNIQYGYYWTLPWGTEGLDSRESLRVIEEGWVAMGPLVGLITTAS